MTAQHTPGPWIQIGNQVGVEIGIVATVHSPKLSTLEEFANARLIAAAPDLLFCLQVICEHAGDDFERLDGMLHLSEAKKAIAKATGGAA